MRALPLLLVGLLGSANAGVIIGGSPHKLWSTSALRQGLPGLRPITWGGIIDGSPHKLVDCADLRPLTRGWRPASAEIRIKGLRWVARDGKERRVPVGLDLAAGPPITAPPGEWTDLILELDGPLSVSTPEGAQLSLTVPEIGVVLDTPAAGGDEIVVLLSLTGEQILDLADAGAVGDDHPLAGELRLTLLDGAVGCQVE